jgi:hypothetical protein
MDLCVNHFKWFLVAFFSLTLSIIFSGSFFKLWVAYDIQQAAIAAEQALEQISLNAKNERLKQERINMVKAKDLQKASAKRASELRQKKSANKANRETCSFWRSEYSKNKTDRAKNFMLSSCSRITGSVF